MSGSGRGKQTVMGTRISIVDVGVACVAIVIAAAVLARSDLSLFMPRASTDPRRPPELPLSLADAAVKGAQSASVAVIEFGDFQCPFCRQFAVSTLPLLDAEYLSVGKVKFVYRHLPLSRIHGQARRAAGIAECSRRQGRFWEVHDRLFEHQGNLGDALYLGVVTQIGLDFPRVEACVDGEAARALDSDIGIANGLKVTSTPTFFVGTVTDSGDVKVGTVLIGDPGIQEFRRILDKSLKR